MRSKVFFTTSAVLLLMMALALPLAALRTAPTAVATIDGEAACQACNAQAYENWSQCWRQYNDIGDSECMGKLQDALSACGSTACIYITRNNTTADAIAQALTPGAMDPNGQRRLSSTRKN
jgi:hypothetical protein